MIYEKKHLKSDQNERGILIALFDFLNSTPVTIGRFKNALEIN
jgi:hypothetical protein